MGSELRDEVGRISSQEKKSYSEIIDECFPYYLSIGMTEEQYWEGENTLPIFFRKADKLRREQQQNDMDYQCWLQGRYIYEAICCVSPILHAFAKAGTKPIDYMSKPYLQLQKEKEDEALKAQLAENERLKALLFFKTWANDTSKKFDKK